ncbi:uncharacterized protein AMSG_02266 [Thecamonas trahens ATCC 50062]|uniref:K Homology domain-containing protein n=1 Tax=Thecamonas trahens ATCC 50062 TaxID=461836 RepID=A0A0L0DW45_THETB|nr:hypothetical protein AMSG_02266 [Thecamonas trahens ATCC 50062]KNC56296.1 hypothetical protein AMSG_02266 [Thecamonas trahens ATCC 50062]|eukprot:XP_013760815.1 hypothetical protein AMSG_02266 [Thecamonas trahens ATCC 50062]
MTSTADIRGVAETDYAAALGVEWHNVIAELAPAQAAPTYPADDAATVISAIDTGAVDAVTHAIVDLPRLGWAAETAPSSTLGMFARVFFAALLAGESNVPPLAGLAGGGERAGLAAPGTATVTAARRFVLLAAEAIALKAEAADGHKGKNHGWVVLSKGLRSGFVGSVQQLRIAALSHATLRASPPASAREELLLALAALETEQEADTCTDAWVTAGRMLLALAPHPGPELDGVAEMAASRGLWRGLRLAISVGRAGRLHVVHPIRGSVLHALAAGGGSRRRPRPRPAAAELELAAATVAVLEGVVAQRAGLTPNGCSVIGHMLSMQRGYDRARPSMLARATRCATVRALLETWAHKTAAVPESAAPELGATADDDPLTRQLQEAWLRVQSVNRSLAGPLDRLLLPRSKPEPPQLFPRLGEVEPGMVATEQWLAIPLAQLKTVVGRSGRVIRPLQRSHGVVVLTPERDAVVSPPSPAAAPTRIVVLAILGSARRVRNAAAELVGLARRGQRHDQHFRSLRARTGQPRTL